MKTRGDCIVFTGGGSGGHVYPGLALIEQLRKGWTGRIVWIGSGKAVEKAAVEKENIEFIAIPSGKFRRSLSLQNFGDLFKIAAGFFCALYHLSKLRPCLIFSKGGYVSVPPCAAAAVLGIPYFTHESDVTPGLATRINARNAAAILVSWQQTLSWLNPSNRRKTIVTGNPVRELFSYGDAARGKAVLGCPATTPLLLILGGSQGAKQVNDMVAAALPRFHGKVFVAHQTGTGAKPCQEPNEWYRGFDFIHTGMADIYAAATIIAGRAGAGTIWEATAAGRPLVLIPLAGAATRGDQVHNARLLQEAGGSIMLLGDDATPESLISAVLDLLSSAQKREAMVKAAQAIINPSAARDIAGLIQSQIKR